MGRFCIIRPQHSGDLRQAGAAHNDPMTHPESAPATSPRRRRWLRWAVLTPMALMAAGALALFPVGGGQRQRLAWGGVFVVLASNIALVTFGRSGYVIALATQMVVFPLWGVQASLTQNLGIGASFTAVSIATATLPSCG